MNERPDLLEQDITIYGYPLKDLFVFAYACRKQGIDEYDLARFVSNCEFAYKVILEEREEALQKALPQIMEDGSWKITI